MIIRLYEKKIFAPYKCGIRYLQEVFGTYEEFYHYEIPTFSYETFFIVREPFEQLKSALHTELLDHREEKEFYNKFEKFIINNGIKTKHYVNSLYKTIYFYKLKNKNCKIVNINNLTDLAKSFGKNVEFDKKKYDWRYERKNWISKEDFYEQLKILFPKEIQILENWMVDENIFYNKLFENDKTKNNLI